MTTAIPASSFCFVVITLAVGAKIAVVGRIWYICCVFLLKRDTAPEKCNQTGLRQFGEPEADVNWCGVTRRRRIYANTNMHEIARICSLIHSAFAYARTAARTIKA